MLARCANAWQMKSAMFARNMSTAVFIRFYANIEPLLATAAMALLVEGVEGSICDNKTKLLESHLSGYTHKHWVLLNV